MKSQRHNRQKSRKNQKSRKMRRHYSKRRSMKGGITTTGGNFIQIGTDSMQQYFTNPAGGISYGGKKHNNTRKIKYRHPQSHLYHHKLQKGGQCYNCISGMFNNIGNNSSTA